MKNTMEKRTACLFFSLLCLFLNLSSLFATARLQSSLTNAIGLEGFIIQAHTVTIEPLVESGSLGYGMPFSIIGDDVQEAVDKTTGRRIAAWNIESSYSPLKVSIKAAPLAHISEDTRIDYYICFKYSYDKYDDNGGTVGLQEGWLVVSSTEGEVAATLSNQSPNGQTYPIASQSQDVRFMLHTYTDAQKDAWEGGVYIATVTIVVSGG